MSKGKRASQIKNIPIDRINIMNPRVRNKKVFYEITENIAQVGLKRPITVKHSTVAGKDYDLICGQGRLEAFLLCGQTEIPAIIIEADEEEALIMSLVENLARRQHNALDLLKGIEILRTQGHNPKSIAAKTGLCQDYVYTILNLLERGEERLISAVENGKITLTLALAIAQSPSDEQRVLQEAYETKQLRGNKLLEVQKLLERRRRLGKSAKGGSQGHSRNRKEEVLSTKFVLKVYQKEVDRKTMMTRKAEQVGHHLTFVTEAMHQLFREENFNNLLRTEGLDTMPKQLSDLLAERGKSYG
jgi:ParB family chromosome partitioning protein